MKKDWRVTNEITDISTASTISSYSFISTTSYLATSAKSTVTESDPINAISNPTSSTQCNQIKYPWLSFFPRKVLYNFGHQLNLCEIILAFSWKFRNKARIQTDQHFQFYILKFRVYLYMYHIVKQRLVWWKDNNSNSSNQIKFQSSVSKSKQDAGC